MLTIETFTAFVFGLFITIVFLFVLDAGTPNSKRMAPIRVRVDEKKRRYSPPPQEEPQYNDFSLLFMLLVVLVSVFLAGQLL